MSILCICHALVNKVVCVYTLSAWSGRGRITLNSTQYEKANTLFSDFLIRKKTYFRRRIKPNVHVEKMLTLL